MLEPVQPSTEISVSTVCVCACVCGLHCQFHDWGAYIASLCVGGATCGYVGVPDLCVWLSVKCILTL